MMERLPKPVTKRLNVWAGTLLALFFIFTVLIAPAVFEPLLVLAIGLWKFLVRTIPRMTWNWDLIGMGVVCVILITVIGQYLLAWLTRQVAQKWNRNWRWRWKWTLCSLVAVALTFLIGMSVGGIVHQVGWLTTQNEPWYERKGEEISTLYELHGILVEAELDHEGNLEKIRRELRDPENFQRREGGWFAPESYHLLLIINETNQIEGSIIFPRNFNRSSRWRGLYQFGDSRTFFREEQLPEIIERHRRQLFSL